MIKITTILLTVLAVLAGVYLAINRYLGSQGSDNKPVTLTVWGVKDDSAIMADVIAGYNKLRPNVTVIFTPQSLENYRTRVQTQVLVGQSADIVAIHNSWLPMFLANKLLAPAPGGLWGPGEYDGAFYKVVPDSFISGGKIYGIPSEVDGLALFYNQDILKGQNIAVPKTWDDLVVAALKTTVVDKQSGKMITGGVGLGNTDNVDRWSQIVGLLFLQQPNADITNPDNQAGREIVSFYNNPSGSPDKKVWSRDLGSTTRSFAAGKLAFYLGTVEDARMIKQTNPSLRFGVAPVPQLPDKKVDFACFWGYGVSGKSKNQAEAWRFLKFLTNRATEQYIFEQETAKFGLGRPYPRTALAGQLESDPVLGSFAAQGPIYKTWYLCPNTGDRGLNDGMIAAFKSGIDEGKLDELSASIKTIDSKYTTPLK